MNAKLLGMVASVVMVLVVGGSGAVPAGGAAGEGRMKISGPYVHENLTVFLIHGTDRIKGKNYLTLQEAMERKLVIVHETGDVNELSVENISKDQDVFIQSGDIVKGGRQDRTIAMDFICPPGSGKMPIEAFCVEHGRWAARATESAVQFAGSTDALAGKELRLAAKQSGQQTEVWRQVAVNQQKLSTATSQPVAAALSPTSFQLSLESQAVQGHTAEYIKAISPAIDGKDDVIGYAFAINGKINSADVYASHALFVKLWPKLLKSSVVEALAEVKDVKKFGPATAEAVRACIADARGGKATEKDVTPRVRIVTKESAGNVVFETRDRRMDDGLIHESYVNMR
jgi:hypothetical protein